jgi:hypothetical protein
MRSLDDLKIGCSFNGTTHSSEAIPDAATKVKMCKDAGVFDYIDRSPPDEEFRELLRASEAHDLPVTASGWFYTLGRDEKLFERNILKGRLLGTRVHNVQVMTNHADGHRLTDQEVTEFYLRAQEFGMRHEVTPCFEVHVNMWSEHYGRIAKVAKLVEARGVPFRMTLDHSHVIFKIDNPREQAVQEMREDVEAGRVVLEPDRPGNVTQLWIDSNWVHHAHARAAIPNNPVNTRAKHPDGSFGRGIQVPFVRPGPGEWVAEWDEAKLEPWKLVLRNLMRHHAADPQSAIGQISCEHIPSVDYGAGHGYSIFEQNVACARWMRDEWRKTLAESNVKH